MSNANTNRLLTFTSEQAAEDWLRSVGRPGCAMRLGQENVWVALSNHIFLPGGERDRAISDFWAFTAPDRATVLY